MAAPRLPEPGRFQASRPSELRQAPPWHPLAYIVRRLPRAIEEMSADLRVAPGDRILDYGCADAPYRDLFAAAEYVGADLPGNAGAAVELRADGGLPLEDASFDAVLSTQVLEHVDDPALYLGECERVLRPGGRILLSTHGTMVYHPDPVDYWRWTCEGLQRSVAAAGLEIERFEGVVGLSATGLQLFQYGLLQHLPAVIHKPVALGFQTLIALADRLDGAESRRLNALVFALVARKPDRPTP